MQVRLQFYTVHLALYTVNNNEKIIKLNKVVVSELPLVLCSGHLTFNNTRPLPTQKKDNFKLAGTESRKLF